MKEQTSLVSESSIRVDVEWQIDGVKHIIALDKKDCKEGVYKYNTQDS